MRYNLEELNRKAQDLLPKGCVPIRAGVDFDRKTIWLKYNDEKCTPQIIEKTI